MVLSSAHKRGEIEFRDLGLNSRGKAEISGAEVNMRREHKSQDKGIKGHCNDHTETVKINVRNPVTTEEGARTGPQVGPPSKL